MQSIPHFKNQVVRDLAWSCFGPNLIDKFPPHDIHSLELEFNTERQQRLLELDENPEPLLTHLADLKSHRLGLYFEALWKFFLLQDTQLELIAHNIPIRNDERTLGELDVVYRDTLSDEYTHLELAVKFYLNIQTARFSTEPSDFLGPNCRDRLDKKLGRFLSHQSPLSDAAESKQILADLGVERVQKKIAIKGQLFYYDPFLPLAENCTPLSPDHQKGWWTHLSTFKESVRQGENWVVLDKNLWLSPATLCGNKERSIFTADQLVAFLDHTCKTDQRPRMVCSMQKTMTTFHEAQRYFITPDDWPSNLSSGRTMI